MIHSDNAATCEELLIEFMRVVNNWEAAGGGSFTNNSMELTAYDSAAADVTFEKGTVLELSGSFYLKLMTNVS